MANCNVSHVPPSWGMTEGEHDLYNGYKYVIDNKECFVLPNLGEFARKRVVHPGNNATKTRPEESHSKAAEEYATKMRKENQTAQIVHR